MLKVQYKHLKSVGKFLMKLSLKGKKSVHRMRIVKVLDAQLKKFGEEEIALLKEYAETDEEGELVYENNSLKITGDKREFKKQQEELYNEYFTIEDVNLETALNTIEEIVNDYNKELSDEDAEAHFLLVEAFETQNNNEESGE